MSQCVLLGVAEGSGGVISAQSTGSVKHEVRARLLHGLSRFLETGDHDGRQHLQQQLLTAAASGHDLDEDDHVGNEGCYFAGGQRYCVRYVRCQRLWVFAITALGSGGYNVQSSVESTCNPCVGSRFESCSDDAWVSGAVLGPSLDLVIALCRGKVSVKRLYKRFAELSLGLLKILGTGRPSAATMTSCLGGNGVDELSRIKEWIPTANASLVRGRKLSSLLDFDRSVSVPLPLSEQKLSAAVSSKLNGLSTSKKRKAKRREMLQVAQDLQAKLFETEFGNDFVPSSSDEDQDDEEQEEHWLQFADQANSKASATVSLSNESLQSTILDAMQGDADRKIAKRHEPTRDVEQSLGSWDPFDGTNGAADVANTAANDKFELEANGDDFPWTPFGNDDQAGSHLKQETLYQSWDPFQDATETPSKQLVRPDNHDVSDKNETSPSWNPFE